MGERKLSDAESWALWQAFSGLTSTARFCRGMYEGSCDRFYQNEAREYARRARELMKAFHTLYVESIYASPRR